MADDKSGAPASKAPATRREGPGEPEFLKDYQQQRDEMEQGADQEADLIRSQAEGELDEQDEDEDTR